MSFEGLVTLKMLLTEFWSFEATFTQHLCNTVYGLVIQTGDKGNETIHVSVLLIHKNTH